MNLPSSREPPLPGPLLHKGVEERENSQELALHEPAVSPAGWRPNFLAFCLSQLTGGVLH
jgi:hypothetical protein